MIASLLWLVAGFCIVGGLMLIALGSLGMGLAFLAAGVGCGVEGDMRRRGHA